MSQPAIISACSGQTQQPTINSTSALSFDDILIFVLAGALGISLIVIAVLLDSFVKGDLGTVIIKTLDYSPDTPLILDLTPLMLVSSREHVDIVDGLIQAGPNVNKQESHFWFTPLFFAVKGSKSFSKLKYS